MQLSSPKQRLPVRSVLCLVLLGALVVIAPWVRSRISSGLAAEATLYRGAAALESGNAGQAETEWLAAARIAPSNPNVYRALGGLYLTQRRFPEARAALGRLADLAPGEPHTLCQLAEAELQDGSTALLQAASEDGARAAALEPDCVRAQTVAGNAWLTRGDARRATAYLRRACALNPADVPLALHLAKTQLQLQQPREAARVATQLTRRYPGFAQAFVVLATCYLTYPPNSPEARDVVHLLEEALSLDPTLAEAHARLGNLYLAHQDPQAALSHLKAAHLLLPANSAVLFDLGRACRALGLREEADRFSAEFRKRSEWENEAAALERKLMLDPGNEALYRRLDVVSRQLGDPDRLTRARARAAAPAAANAAPGP